MKHLIVISGPTASGKTSLSIALAKQLNTCIISADSRQFYKELSIGTAKPSIREQDGVHHYLINSHSVTEELTSAQFEKLAMEILEEEFKTKEVVILVGGSGMFIDALCLGLDDIPTSPEIKKQIQLEYDEDGLYPLLDELKDKDPEYYDEVDQNNSMRVQRAIEVIRITGKKFSDLRKSKPVPRPFKVYRFVIDHDRDVLYDRINRRVDLMLEEGLLEEVKSVEQYRNLSSLNTVGYKELFEFLDGKIAFQEAVELIKRNTRRYAKRQLTWFRRHPETHWIPYDTAEVMVKKVIGIFNAQ